MQCYNCGADLTEKDFCTNCGADVSRYKKLLSFSNYYYNEGLDKAGVRDLSGAVESLKLALKFNKYHIEARNLLGLIYFELGEIVPALSEWVISKNLRPEKNVADDYIDAVQKSPAQLEDFAQMSRKFNQALNYCYQDSRDLARIQLKKVLSDHPSFVQAHLLLALLYMDQKEWEKARKELNRCLRIDRANTMALRYMKEVDAALKAEDDGGRMSRRQSRVDEVVKYQSGNETIIQPVNHLIEPKKSMGWLWGILAGLAVGVAVSWFLILPARVQSAQTELNNRLTAVGEEKDQKNAEIDSLTQQVENLTRQNQELTAQNEELSGTDGQMGTVEALLNAAYLYITAPDDTEALADAIDRIDQETMEGMASNSAARQLYEELLKSTGTDLASAYYDSGYRAYRSRDYETAIEDLSRAVSYDAENSEALYALANAYRDNGNRRQAQDTYEKVIELFPGTEKASQSQRAIDQLAEE
ncbi:MAG: tetratricopeptide repeat protein [Eubacteriales bacterium]|nr:tetratricopeptide repeat protein [Eubacteriales bacterium]